MPKSEVDKFTKFYTMLTNQIRNIIFLELRCIKLTENIHFKNRKIKSLMKEKKQLH